MKKPLLLLLLLCGLVGAFADDYDEQARYITERVFEMIRANDFSEVGDYYSPEALRRFKEIFLGLKDADRRRVVPTIFGVSSYAEFESLPEKAVITKLMELVMKQLAVQASSLSIGMEYHGGFFSESEGRYFGVYTTVVGMGGVTVSKYGVMAFSVIDGALCLDMSGDIENLAAVLKNNL